MSSQTHDNLIIDEYNLCNDIAVGDIYYLQSILFNRQLSLDYISNIINYNYYIKDSTEHNFKDLSVNLIHLSVIHKQYCILRLLLSFYGDCEIKDSRGNNAYQIALILRDETSIKILEGNMSRYSIMYYRYITLANTNILIDENLYVYDTIDKTNIKMIENKKENLRYLINNIINSKQTMNNDDKNIIEKYVNIGINYPFYVDIHDYFKSTLKNRNIIELYKKNPYLAKLLNVDELRYRYTELGITLLYIFEKNKASNYHLPIELWIYIFKILLQYYQHSNVLIAPKVNDKDDKLICTVLPRKRY